MFLLKKKNRRRDLLGGKIFGKIFSAPHDNRHMSFGALFVPSVADQTKLVPRRDDDGRSRRLTASSRFLKRRFPCQRKRTPPQRHRPSCVFQRPAPLLRSKRWRTNRAGGGKKPRTSSTERRMNAPPYEGGHHEPNSHTPRWASSVRFPQHDRVQAGSVTPSNEKLFPVQIIPYFPCKQYFPCKLDSVPPSNEKIFPIQIIPYASHEF